MGTSLLQRSHEITAYIKKILIENEIPFDGTSCWIEIGINVPNGKKQKIAQIDTHNWRISVFQTPDFSNSPNEVVEIGLGVEEWQYNLKFPNVGIIFPDVSNVQELRINLKHAYLSEDDQYIEYPDPCLIFEEGYFNDFVKLKILRVRNQYQTEGVPFQKIKSNMFSYKILPNIEEILNHNEGIDENFYYDCHNLLRLETFPKSTIIKGNTVLDPINFNTLENCKKLRFIKFGFNVIFKMDETDVSIHFHDNRKYVDRQVNEWWYETRLGRNKLISISEILQKYNIEISPKELINFSVVVFHPSGELMELRLDKGTYILYENKGWAPMEIDAKPEYPKRNIGYQQLISIRNNTKTKDYFYEIDERVYDEFNLIGWD